MQLVLIHNIGHHDLYLASGGDESGHGVRALFRPNRVRMRDTSAALRSHTGAVETWLDGRGVRLDPPLGISLDGAPADRLVAPLLAAWHEAQPKLAYARQRFNEAAEAHDSAIALFPTTLLARVFGMAPVGRV